DSSIVETLSGGINVATFGGQPPTASSGNHIVEMIATGTKSPLTLVGGSGDMEFWKDQAGGSGLPTAAVSFGMAQPGGSSTSDMVFSAWNGSSWSERMRMTNGGNVGIGTTSPLGRLQVATANDTNPGFITAWDARHFVIGGPSSSGGIGFSYDQTNQLGYIEALSPNVAWRSLVLQSGGGNVRIGTSSPAARLAVRGDGIDVVIGSAGCGAPTAAIGFDAMGPCTNYALGANVNNTADAGVFLNRPIGRSLHFREGNQSDQMTIVPGGNVGIGTSSPYPFASLHATSRSVGVLGESNDIINGLGGWFKNTGNTAAVAIRADGNAVQTLESGGWVKAMAYVDPANGIQNCYNSQASGLVRT